MSRTVIAADLPAHGQSAPSSFSPPGWAAEVADLLDGLGLDRVPVVGHSSGGWTALELAKSGRASGVLALAPAGLWRRHSPRSVDAGLKVNWQLARRMGGFSERALRYRAGRAASLRQISAKPAAVPAAVAIEAARAAATSVHFPKHFAQTRILRFEGGQQIPQEVAVHVVWGAGDRVAKRRTSRFTDQLPKHAQVETWDRCGHMVMWDAPDRLVQTATSLSEGT